MLVSYHPHFKALGNRLLRRVMAPRVTIAQAAGMAGVPVQELLTALRSAVGEVAATETCHPAFSTELHDRQLVISYNPGYQHLLKDL